MKAIVVTDEAAGTAGMTLVERPEPEPAINDVVVQVHASGFTSGELTWPSTWTDRLLHVPQRDPGIQRGGDEGVPERVGRDGLADPGATRGAADDPPGAVPVQPPSVRGQEHRPAGAFPDGQVDCPGGARRERDGDDLAALIRTTGSASGRLGTWWPPAGEHSSAQDFESFRKSVPLPVTRES